MLINILLLVLVAGLGYFTWRFSTECARLHARYGAILDVEEAVALAKTTLEQTRRQQQEEGIQAERERQKREQEHERRLAEQESAARTELDRLQNELQRFLAEDQERREKLNSEYQQAHETYEGLKRELSLVEDTLEDMTFGLYKPHFTFQTPEDYKKALTDLRDRERNLIAQGQAAVCPIAWRVGNSEKEGARMVKQNTKLILRAFNGECEAARADVSWNNITKMEERIRKSCEAINKLSGVLKVSITLEYLNLRLDELRLTHEYENKKYQEREELRRIRERIREEERAQQELEKAQLAAEEEEERYQKALAKARDEAAQATGAILQKLTKQISAFETKLDEARQRKERAVSRAQLTKSGFVYVISNIGSFGERVYKIGMTRRMEPMDRITELGDASVPFPFDLHAMLYSDNAPELENGLHQLFENRRVNLVNPRREFYHSVDLEEIESYVKSKGLSAQFIRKPEAREYRETLARRELAQPRAPEPDNFSGTLFPGDAHSNQEQESALAEK